MSEHKQPPSVPSDEPIPFSSQDNAPSQSQNQTQPLTAAATPSPNLATQPPPQQEEEKEDEEQKEEIITHAVPKGTLPGEQPVNMPSSPAVSNPAISSPAVSSPAVSQTRSANSNTASPVVASHLSAGVNAPQGVNSPQQPIPSVSSQSAQLSSQQQQQQQQHVPHATVGASGVHGSIGAEPLHAPHAVSSPVAQSFATPAVGASTGTAPLGSGVNTRVEPVQPPQQPQQPQQLQQQPSPMAGFSSPYAQQHQTGAPSQQPSILQNSGYSGPYQQQQHQHQHQQQGPPQPIASAMASSSNAVEPSDSGSDPQVQQWTSAFWRNTGRVQSVLGEWTGVESWRNAGQSTEQWAEQSYADARARAEAGQASRLHGEYERMMGMLGTAMGHVAGDPEMEAKARLRARQGQEEIDETRR